MQHVEVEHWYRAPVERVWARYTDHVSWTVITRIFRGALRGLERDLAAA